MAKYSVVASLRLQADQRSLAQLRSSAEKAVSNLGVTFNARGAAAFQKQLQEIDKTGSHVARSLAEIGAQTKAIYRISNGNGKISPISKTWGLNIQKATEALADYQQLALSNAGTNGKAIAIANKHRGVFERLTDTTAQLNETHEKLANGTGKVIQGWTSLVSQSIAVYGAYSRINDAIKTNIDLMEQSVNLGQIQNQRIGSPTIQGFVGQARGLAQQYGTKGGAPAVLSAYAELEQAGISEPKLMETLAKLSLNKQVGQLSDVSSLMVQIARAWSITEQKDVEKYFSTMLRASKETKATFESLVDASSILNNVVRNLGGSYEGLFALVSKTMDTTGRSGSEIARTQNTVFTNMLAKPDLRGKLAKYGVDLFTYDPATGAKVFDEPIKNLRKIKNLVDELGGPNSLLGGDIVTEVGGVRRNPILAGVFEALPAIEEFQQSLKQNISDPINSDVSIALDSVENKLNRLKNTFDNTIGNILASKGMQNLGKTALDASTSILKLVDAFSDLVPLLLVLGAGKAFGGALKGLPFIGAAGGGFGGAGSLGYKKSFTDTIGKAEKLQLLKLNQQEIAQKFKGLETYKVEQYARIKTADEIRKGTRIFTNLNGVVQKVSISQQRLINRQNLSNAVMGKIGANGFALGAVGLAAVSQFGGGGPGSQAVQAGGEVGLLGAALGLHPFVSATAAAVVALNRFSDATAAAQSDVERGYIEKSRSRQAELEKLGLTGTRQYSQAILQKYSGQAQLEDNISTPYNKLTWGEELSYLWRSLKAGKGGPMDEFRKQAQSDADNSRAQFADTLRADTEAIVKRFGYTSADQFRQGDGDDIFRIGSIITKDFPKILEQIIEEVNANKASTVLEEKRKVLPRYDASGVGAITNMYTRNRNFSGLDSVGTDAFIDAVNRLPAEFDKASLLAVNSVKNLLPSLLKAGFAKEDLVPSVEDGLRRAGLAEGIVQSISVELQSMDLESISAGTADLGKVTDELIGAWSGDLIPKTIEAKNALVAFTEQLVDSLNKLSEQRTKFADSQADAQKALLEVRKQVVAFSGGSVMGFAGAGNAIAQQRAAALGGTSNVGELGRRLSILQKEYEAAAGNEFRQDAIVSVINNLKQALQGLGNTADRTGDIFEALNEENQKELSRKNFVKGYFTGSAKDRLNTLRGLQETSRVTQQNLTLNDLPISVQQRVIQTLESLGTSPFAGSGGKGADKILDELLSRSSGFDFVRGTPEKQNLQAQAITVMNDAAGAMRALAAAEAEQMNQLFRGLEAENRRFLNGLGGLFRARPAADPYAWVGSGAVAGPTSGAMSAPINMEGFINASNMINVASQNLQNVVNVMHGLTLSHTFNGTLNVLLNGASCLNQMVPELQKYVTTEIQKALQNFVNKNLPDLGVIK